MRQSSCGIMRLEILNGPWRVTPTQFSMWLSIPRATFLVSLWFCDCVFVIHHSLLIEVLFSRGWFDAATCSADLTIKIWDLQNEYVCVKTLFGHDHNVSCVVFHPSGDTLLSSSRDQSIKIWETGTGWVNLPTPWFVREKVLILFFFFFHSPSSVTVWRHWLATATGSGRLFWMKVALSSSAARMIRFTIHQYAIHLIWCFNSDYCFIIPSFLL